LSEAAKLRALQIAAGCFLVTFFVARVAGPLADLDMWHEMALIRESLAAGHILTVDVFAYTPTIRPVVDHEWGAGALLYLTVQSAGGWGVVALKYLVALLTGAAVLRCARLRRAGFEGFTVLAPLAIPLFAIGCATLRAQAYSFLFFAVLLWLLELDAAGKRHWIAGCPLLFALWVNLHGGCVVGLVALGLYWLEQLARRRPHIHVLAITVASTAAFAVNPYGFAYYRQLWNALRMPRPEITEWYSITVASNFHQTLFWITLAIAAYAVFVRGWRESGGVLILAAIAGAAVLHLRMVPFYAVAWTAFVPSYISATPAGAFIRSVFRRRTAATAVCLILAMFFGVMAIEIGFYKLVVPNHQFPVGAVRYLKDIQFHGNVMTHFEHGGYVSWWLYPAAKVSMDSRYETAFAPAVVDESFGFYEARPGWRQELAKYPTDLVLVPLNTAVAKLMSSTNWDLVYRDQAFRLYARPGLTLPFRDDSARSFPTSFP
jgi:hypothetical protein